MNSLHAVACLRRIITLQIYADVIGLPIKVSASNNPRTWFACLAPLRKKGPGGYDSILTLRNDGTLKDKCIYPFPRSEDYESYMLNVILHDYFGRGSNDVMKG